VQLLSAMVGIINAGEYGRAIHDSWIRRQLIEIGNGIVSTAYGNGGEADGRAQIEAAERALGDLICTGRRDRVMTIGEAVAAAIAQAEAIYKGGRSPGLLTGMYTVDQALGGLWPGDFDLLAGIPGAGKTALAVQIGYSLAQRLYNAAIATGATEDEAKRIPGVVVFSLEMSAEELGARIAAYRAGISVEQLRTGRLSADIAVKLLHAQQEADMLPLRIRDCRALSPKLLAARVRMHLMRQPEMLVIVDHLLVLDSDTPKSRNGAGNDVATVAKASRDLKQLAGDTGLPFLTLTHASRASAKRDNPRPTMGDVKWAGEGDADCVAFIHRPIMFMSSDPPRRGDKEGEEAYASRLNRWHDERDASQDLAELVVAKRRMGATGVWRLRFNGPSTSFDEWAA